MVKTREADVQLRTKRKTVSMKTYVQKFIRRIRVYKNMQSNRINQCENGSIERDV